MTKCNIDSHLPIEQNRQTDAMYRQPDSFTNIHFKLDGLLFGQPQIPDGAKLNRYEQGKLRERVNQNFNRPYGARTAAECPARYMVDLSQVEL
jgi:hypothetical protein